MRRPKKPTKNDRHLAREAEAKVDAGQTPTAREAEALNRVDRWRAYELREELLQELPKSWWVSKSGRQHKTVDEQAELYGAPLLGDAIDLAAFARWFHNFLRDNHTGLAKARRGGGDPESVDARLELAKLEQINERIATLRRQNQLLDREVVEVGDLRSGFAIIGETLRTATEQMLRRLGPANGQIAYEVLDEAWTDCVRTLRDQFAFAYADDDELPNGPERPKKRARAGGTGRVRKPNKKSKGKPAKKAGRVRQRRRKAT